MARSNSKTDKKQSRAIAELENLEKAIRRGQRPAVLMVVDTWLEVSAEVRAKQFEWVQALVGKALDELRTKPPTSSVLVEWQRRLELAPELIQGHAESDEVGHERWWTLLRAALSVRQVVVAEKLWRRLSAATKDLPPKVVRLVEAWLAAPVEGWSDELVAELSSPLEGLRARDPQAQEVRPTLVEPLPRDATREQIRDWVEELFCRPERVAAHVRAASASVGPEQYAWLFTEAAPLLLREALMARDMRSLAVFAGALAHAEQVEPSDVETALRLARAASLSTIKGRHPSRDLDLLMLFRLARAAIQRAPELRDHVRDTLELIGLENLKFSSELGALFNVLLRAGPPDLRLWSLAAASLRLDYVDDLSDIVEALTQRRAILLNHPEATVAAFAAMPSTQVGRALARVSQLFDAAFREEVLFTLWPLAQAGLRAELIHVFMALLVDYESQADDEWYAQQSVLLTSELEDEMLELLDDGVRAEEAAHRLAARFPDEVREELRRSLIAYVDRPLTPIVPACVSLWKRFGKEVVAFDQALLDEGLGVLTDEVVRVELVLAALHGHKDISDWIAYAHKSDVFANPEAAMPTFLEALTRRFGDSIETWRTAFRSGRECPCLLTATLATAWLHAAISQAEPHQEVLDEVLSVFNEDRGQFEGIVRGLESVAKTRVLGHRELIELTWSRHPDEDPAASKDGSP